MSPSGPVAKLAKAARLNAEAAKLSAEAQRLTLEAAEELPEAVGDRTPAPPSAAPPPASNRFTVTDVDVARARRVLRRMGGEKRK